MPLPALMQAGDHARDMLATGRPLIETGGRRAPSLWGLVARGRFLLAGVTEPHLPAPRRRLHPDRGRIQAALADIASRQSS